MTRVIAEVLRAAFVRFMAMVDGDSVRPFIWLYYIPLFFWGIYGTFLAEPLPIMEPVVGAGFYRVWTFLPIVATSTALAGLTLRHGGSSLASMSTPLLFRDWIGLWMQVGGHACMSLVFWSWEVGAISAAYWGQPVISVFALLPYAFGTAILALQCMRKLWRGEQLERDTRP